MADGDATPKVRVTKENLVALPALAPYFAFGLLALAATPFLLMAGAEALQVGLYRHPRVLAALHGAALGFGTSIALGALQQMTAVVGATRLHSSRLATAAFVPFGLGTLGLIVGFYTFSPLAFALALGVPLGTAMVVYNLARTMGAALATRRWIVVEPFVKAAVVYVLVAFAGGAALALNLTRGWLGPWWKDVFPLHISMAAGGWFVMLVIGISYHLLTFFGLTDKGTQFRCARSVHLLLHVGIIAGALASVAASLRTVALLVFSVAGALFLWDARGIYSRPARQQATHVHTYIRVAHGYLAIITVVLFLWGITSGASAFGAVTSGAGAFGAVTSGAGAFGAGTIALGLIFGGGWLSNTILGYLHRILAFFVWHNKYWGRGREPGVPAFRNMVHERLAATGLVVFNIGVLGLLASLYVDISAYWGAGLWAAGALMAAVNLVWTMLR